MQFIRDMRLRSFCNSYFAHSEHCPGECRVASSMQQEQHRTMGTTAVDSENVQGSQDENVPQLCETYRVRDSMWMLLPSCSVQL